MITIITIIIIIVIIEGGKKKETNFATPTSRLQGDAEMEVARALPEAAARSCQDPGPPLSATSIQPSRSKHGPQKNPPLHFPTATAAFFLRPVNVSHLLNPETCEGNQDEGAKP